MLPVYSVRDAPGLYPPPTPTPLYPQNLEIKRLSKNALLQNLEPQWFIGKILINRHLTAISIEMFSRLAICLNPDDSWVLRLSQADFVSGESRFGFLIPLMGTHYCAKTTTMPAQPWRLTQVQPRLRFLRRREKPSVLFLESTLRPTRWLCGSLGKNWVRSSFCVIVAAVYPCLLELASNG